MCQHTAQSAGAIYAWEFERDGKVFTVKGDGQLVFNSIVHVLNGALDGVGLSYIPEALAAPCLADGRLFRGFPLVSAAWHGRLAFSISFNTTIPAHV